MRECGKVVAENRGRETEQRVAEVERREAVTQNLVN